MCINTDGSYHCECPTDMELAEDRETCLKMIQQNIYNRPQRDHPSEIGFVKYAQMVCPDGFILENETCLGN